MKNVEELGEEIANLAAHLDAATHRLLECIRQFDDAHGWHDQGAMSCAHWLAWRVGLDAATAREKVRVARALGSLPRSTRHCAPAGSRTPRSAPSRGWPRRRTKRFC